MGGAISRGRKRVSKSQRPSRHAWGRIQDVDYVESDSGSDDEENEWWMGDRRVLVDERADWPRSCPMLHLNIQEDFPLDGQRRLVRSVFRFWMFSWWISVINFVAVMATLLTSNVTNPSAMVLSFVLSMIYLFAVFFLHFRPLYWALRLESSVLFIWFYVMSILLAGFFVYQITQALGLTSILAEPLAPGSELPVKVNPIFPVILFTLTVVCYFFALVLVVYYISSAIMWHRMTDKEKMKMYKKQQKASWLSPWFGGGGGGDPGLEDIDDDGSKPKYSYQCILSYEQISDGYTDDVEPRSELDRDAKKTLKKKKKKHARDEHDILSIPGTLGVYPAARKIVFEANEAIFNNVFKMTVLLITISSMKTKEETWLYVMEKLNESVLEEERPAYRNLPATCTTNEQTVRILKFDFETTQHRDGCRKQIETLWRQVKKKEQLYIAEDEESLRDIRLKTAQRSLERAAQHLLTHRDWKLLVSFVWRQSFHAGEVILDKGTMFSELMHVTEGTVAIYLETTESAQSRQASKEAAVADDFDLNAALFPRIDEIVRPSAPVMESFHDEVAARSRPRYFTIRFSKRKLGFAYRKKPRAYNFAPYANGPSEPPDKRYFPNNEAAVVHSVKSGSEADKAKIKVGDELVKVGLYDVESNELSQKSITNLIKNHSFPMNIEFRRPPDLSLEEDASGFVRPKRSFLPESARQEFGQFEHMAAEQVQDEPKQVVFRSSAHSFDHEEENALLERARYGEYDTESESDENDAGATSSAREDVVIEMGLTPSTEGLMEYPHFRRRSGAELPGPLPRISDVGSRSYASSQGGRSRQNTGVSRRGSSAEQDLIAFVDDDGIGSGAGAQASPDIDADLSQLELAEDYALDAAERAAAQEAAARGPARGSARGQRQGRAQYRVAPVDTEVEFDANDPTIDELERRRQLEREADERRRMAAFEVEHPSNAAAADKSISRKLLDKGKHFLFGTEVEYDKVQMEDMRNRLAGKGEDTDSDGISIIVDRDGGGGDGDGDGDGDGGGSDGESESSEDFFANMRTFEPVGTYEVGDTIGIVPWILHQPVSVVQLKAITDVVMHSIKVDELSKLFRKNGALALAFFKYVAAVVGERADRDEEKLCDEIEDQLLAFEKKGLGPVSLTRLLDDKPIRSNQKTQFEIRGEETERARQWFENDLDMAFDSIIFQIDCEAQIVGDISVVVGESWKGVDTRDSDVYNEPKPGVLYVTHFHVCFRSKKRALDLARFRRRPTLYGKLHLNDIYELRRFGDAGEKLTILTDDVRLDVSFTDAENAAKIESWIDALCSTGTVVEKAPHSYTLPGDIYKLTSGNKNLPSGVEDDPLNVVYSQQRDLRTEFLILTQTLQQVLSKQDRFKMFHDGRSVTLKRGQNVLVASRMAAKTDSQDNQDPGRSRRTTASKRALKQDGPNGLYLLGSGTLVVQRSVNGRRVQFATYKSGTVFGVERFLTGAPSPFTVKVESERAVLKFAPRERCMALLRSDLSLAARFYQYCSLLQMQRLRGPLLSRPEEDDDNGTVSSQSRGSRGCAIL